MTLYRYQRLVLELAKEKGWTGEIPGVLGTYTAQKAVAEAEAFLKVHHVDVPQPKETTQ